MRMNKLSIETLTAAFAEEEGLDGRVFVVFATKETLKVLRAFRKAMCSEEGTSTLWGALLVEGPTVPEGTLLLGLHRSAETQISFFEEALLSGLRGTDEVTWETKVWGAIKSFD